MSYYLLYFEYTATALAIAGAFLLAIKNPLTPWAWLLWMFSNGFWLAYAVCTRQWGLFIQNAVFSVSSGIGLWTWLIKPYLSKKKINAMR